MMPCDAHMPVPPDMPDDARRPHAADAPGDADAGEDADRSPDAAALPSRTVLLGADHEGWGTAVTAPVGDRVAVGIARGWRPKPYAYVDPNEDAVGAVAGERAQVLAVADGHNGRHASHAAMRAVMDLLGSGPHRPDLSHDRLVEVVATVDDRVCARPVTGRVRSRTTLVVALRSRSVLQWASVGDSALLVVADGRPRLLSSPTRWFVGDGLRRDAMLPTLPAGTIDLPVSAWVVLATDGWTDWLPQGLTPHTAARTALSGVGEPERAVSVLLGQARDGGAGDNVGVAVSAPWYKPRDADDDILDPDR
jgi:serine/threonine protein phosphatase PrpC